MPVRYHSNRVGVLALDTASATLAYSAEALAMSALSFASHGPGRLATPLTSSLACVTWRAVASIIAFHFSSDAVSREACPSLTPTKAAQRMPTAIRPPSIARWLDLRAPLGTERYRSTPRTSWKPPNMSGPHAMMYVPVENA